MDPKPFFKKGKRNKKNHKYVKRGAFVLNGDKGEITENGWHVENIFDKTNVFFFCLFV